MLQMRWCHTANDDRATIYNSLAYVTAAHVTPQRGVTRADATDNLFQRAMRLIQSLRLLPAHASSSSRPWDKMGRAFWSFSVDILLRWTCNPLSYRTLRFGGPRGAWGRKTIPVPWRLSS